MGSVKNLGVAIVRRTMMGNYIFPLGRIDTRAVYGCEWQNGLLRSEIDFLPGHDHVRGQTIPKQ